MSQPVATLPPLSLLAKISPTPVTGAQLSPKATGPHYQPVFSRVLLREQPIVQTAASERPGQRKGSFHCYLCVPQDFCQCKEWRPIHPSLSKGLIIRLHVKDRRSISRKFGHRNTLGFASRILSSVFKTTLVSEK